MSAPKPGSLPRWADAGGAIVVPPSGTLDVGYVPGVSPLHTYDNWYRNLVYQWAQWLNDGDVAFHNLSATGTLGVTGVSTLTGLLNANGGIAIPTGQAVALAGNTTLTTGSGAATFGGAVNANAGIAVPTGQAVALAGSTTLAVGGLITASAGLTADVNQNVTVSGTGTYKHGNQPIVIPASAANSPSIAGSFWSFNSDTQHWLSNAANDQLSFPLMIPAGRRILSIDIWYQRAGGTLTFDFRKTVLSSNLGSSIANTTVNSGTTYTSVTLPSINYTLLGAEQYQVRVTAGAASDQAFAVVATYDN